jgi:hypothetical protein
MYLWAALQTHIILQGYIEFKCIAYPEVSSVVVEHLIQSRVPMTMYEALKTDMSGFKSSAKVSTTSVEKLESKMAHQAESIIKLHQDGKVSLKKWQKRLRDELREDPRKVIKYCHVTLETPVLDIPWLGSRRELWKSAKLEKVWKLVAYLPKPGLNGWQWKAPLIWIYSWCVWAREGGYFCGLSSESLPKNNFYHLGTGDYITSGEFNFFPPLDDNLDKQSMTMWHAVIAVLRKWRSFYLPRPGTGKVSQFQYFIVMWAGALIWRE